MTSKNRGEIHAKDKALKKNKGNKIKHTIIAMNNAFDGLTGRLDTGDSVILEM